MSNAIRTEAREAAALLLTDGATPKDAIAKLEAFASDAIVESFLEDLKGLPWNAKAKAKGELEALIAALDEAEAEGPQAIARIPEIEEEIKGHLASAAKSLLTVGDLLNEARGEFESAKEFLAWSFEKFGFKKAYVHRLMKVADDFPKGDALRSQSINVLHKLGGFPEEVQQEVRKRVEEGENVTGAELERLRQAGKPAPEDAQGAPEQGAETEQGQSTGVDTNGQHGPDLGQDEGAPWDSGTGAERPEAGTEVTLSQVPAPAPEASEEVKRLTRIIEELQAELAASRTERENKAKGKAQAPNLPQFASACMYARLGLSQVQSKVASEVRQAFRALVKAGYNSQHEAYPKLVEAKDYLLGEQAKAA